MELETVNQPSPNVQPHYNSQPEMGPVISVKEWLVTILLLAIPIVNLIMLFVWGFGGGANKSLANYAKAALIWVLIITVVYILFFVLIFGLLFSNM